MSNPYIDPATGAHYNKLGITDRVKLQEVEYGLTDMRVAQLQVSPIKGAFDLDHLKAIHKHVFQDLYEWAGQTRSINFSKRDPSEPHWKSVFAPHSEISRIDQAIRDDLRAWNQLKGLSRDDFTTKLSAVYIQLNYMHPFPEGNGRSTQTFLAQLAQEAGRRLDFGRISSLEWNVAASRSMPQAHIREPGVTREPNVQLIHRAFQQIVAPDRVRLQDAPIRGKGPQR